MTKNVKITKKLREQIREHVGADKIRIHTNDDGIQEVIAYGSSDPYDRSMDYKWFGGYVREVLREIASLA